MKLGIIGCGNMGSAIARGVLSEKILPFNNIYISDKDSQKTRLLHRKFGIRVSTNEDIAKRCDYIIIALKPQDSKKVMVMISKELGSSKHLISVMAGVTISKLESLLGRKAVVTRAMPNMAAAAGKSITALSHNGMVRERRMTQKIFSAIGEVIEIEEKYMDAVTAVSGSGPAYFFYLTEAIRDAAIKMGIKKEHASKLASATLTGSGAVLEALNLAPEALRECVTSKKGTTEAALNVLKAKKFKNIVIEAVKAAAGRSKELSRGE